jgi:hypothetical protein
MMVWPVSGAIVSYVAERTVESMAGNYGEIARKADSVSHVTARR